MPSPSFASATTAFWSGVPLGAEDDIPTTIVQRGYRDDRPQTDTRTVAGSIRFGSRPKPIG